MPTGLKTTKNNSSSKLSGCSHLIKKNSVFFFFFIFTQSEDFHKHLWKMSCRRCSLYSQLAWLLQVSFVSPEWSNVEIMSCFSTVSPQKMKTEAQDYFHLLSTISWQRKPCHCLISIWFLRRSAGPDWKNNPNTSTSASARCINIVRVWRCMARLWCADGRSNWKYWWKRGKCEMKRCKIWKDGKTL